MPIKTQSRNIPLKEIKGMEQYEGYYVDIDGNIWSTKHKKQRRLRYYEMKRNGRTFLTIQITKGDGRKRSFYVHQVIAKAFLPNHANRWAVYHKDGDIYNNSLDNLEWVGKRKDKKSKVLDTEVLTLNTDITSFVKLIHRSCIEKGMRVPATYEFFHEILTESLNEYINRYGLRKTMYQLQQSQTHSPILET